MRLPVTPVILLLAMMGCVEIFNFNIKNNNPTLVVEASISDISFNETLAYPSDGRYFKVKLRETHDVTNIRDNVVSGAEVNLINRENETWHYDESPVGSGDYILKDKDFKALCDQEYKLTIELANGKRYESTWEKIYPSSSVMGEVSFDETEKFEYVREAGEKVINSIQGVTLKVDVPQSGKKSPTYYMWDFEPIWVYIAPLARSSQEDYACWATNPYYMKEYFLETSYGNPFTKDLVFIKTVRNERIFQNLSILIKQYSMSEEYYNFWKEMKEQSIGKGIFEAPPYNLKTNFTSLTDDEKVSGYFGVVEEQTKRWYFSKEELSYFVPNMLKVDCLQSFGGPPAPECLSCLEYTHGTATNKAPSWWPYRY